MLTRMRLVKGATALLYVGPLIAGLGGFGWTMTLPFTAIFVVWLMILRPEQWPASPEEWLTAPAWLAALAQVLSQIVLVAILFGVGRGNVRSDLSYYVDVPLEYAWRSRSNRRRISSDFCGSRAISSQGPRPAGCIAFSTLGVRPGLTAQYSKVLR